jgi:hypothetical protein
VGGAASAAKELARLFPKLWATSEAAKRWLEKEPLKRS